MTVSAARDDDVRPKHAENGGSEIVRQEHGDSVEDGRLERSGDAAQASERGDDDEQPSGREPEADGGERLVVRRQSRLIEAKHRRVEHSRW
jgi:hypothetical protein